MIYDKFKQINYFKVKGKLRIIKEILNQLSTSTDLFSDRINKINDDIELIWKALNSREVSTTTGIDLTIYSQSNYDDYNGTITFYITIKNIGDVTSSPCTLRTTLGSSVNESVINSLSSNESQTITVSFSYDNSIYMEYAINIVADYYRTNRDINFLNNRMSLVFMLGSPPKLDIITGSTVAGSSFSKFSATVKNMSSVKSNSSTVVFEFNGKTKTMHLIALDPNEEKTIYAYFRTPIVIAETWKNVVITTTTDTRTFPVIISPTAVTVEEPATPGEITIYLHLHNNENQEIASIIYSNLINRGYTSEEAIEYVRNQIGYITLEYDETTYTLDFPYLHYYQKISILVETTLVTIQYYYNGQTYEYTIENPVLGSAYHIEHKIDRTVNYDLEDISAIFNEQKQGTFNVSYPYTQAIAKNLKISANIGTEAFGSYEYTHYNGISRFTHNSDNAVFVTGSETWATINWNLSGTTGAYVISDVISSNLFSISTGYYNVKIGNASGGEDIMICGRVNYTRILYDSLFSTSQYYNQLALFHLTDSPYDIIGNTNIEVFL